MPEPRPDTQQVIAENREYTLFSWSVQQQTHPIHMTGGRGSYFYDGDGNTWLDFSSQLINLNVGHQHPKVLEAIKAQVDSMCFAGPSFATDVRAELGKKLAEVTGLAKSFFTLGGSEANENAIKIAKLYTGRDKIITRYRSYHGATMGSMSASGDPRRWPVEPGIPGIVRVFDPYMYRPPMGGSASEWEDGCITHIEEVIQLEGPHTIAAMLVEGITGSNGVLIPPDSYYPRLRALLDKYDILLIDDEVMSGFGRTGKWLATQHYGIVPDIVTCAKGLTSGYMPLGAVVVNQKIADYFENHFLAGGLTYSGHPVSLAAAIANLKVYEEEHLFEHTLELGNYLGERLEAMKRKYACVGDVRSIGLFSVLELVRDKKTKEPLAPYNGTSPEMAKLAAHIKSKHVYAFSRFNMLWVCPPLVITKEELDAGLAVYEEALALVDEMIGAPVAAD
ncbi:aminotransferase class III-fold pyridoxal phosphate-dependent enzyme [Deinococcus metallilatus]|uniref:Aminotransferase class III-fold pyridoxal phosphate-dependent enzyme n=1 Tax=Deinococcus metallilatus TaxID=1211322 RepID=A0AAJ5F5U6_9DEIO|nr:aminotransferase class III-fold pyridoxal phosphate-dependent enzyme [Deinococcus metallilatus]MBB5294958.1 taurine--2-oxoglutarate transaminase [Deinococcus metallilatus]QBY09346.1 aminotransferase class III-fold pyridoxal phosphate-dependent enzyme [Deinococcus metallilatus]RXJ09351.1 aminotransferase class III-fold pyridoxal phosphate-dependent enzyme [Deinococcus metallilatus]TLK28873.1 aminotransferase class III-fold pyridoxal phosphate-dependent enzyme [Deinococcus metallilatus]GMA168